MASNASHIVVTVRLQGGAGTAPTGGTAPPVTPPPIPPPGGGTPPGGTGGGGGRARDRWWWLDLVPSQARERVRRGARAFQGATGQFPGAAASVQRGVGLMRGTPAAAGVIGFGAALGVLTVTIWGLTRAYRAHRKSVDDLTDRLAAGPALQVLQDIAQLRIEIARIQRGAEVRPLLQPAIERRADMQIAVEDLQAELAEMRVRLLEPFVGTLQEDIKRISNFLADIADTVNDSGLIDVGGQIINGYIFGPSAWARWNALFRLLGINIPDPQNQAGFENTLWVFSPDNPANQVQGQRRATFGDQPPGAGPI